jgi:hypothetical protein
MPAVDFGPLSANLPRSTQKGLRWMNLIFNNMANIDCRFYVLRTNTRALNTHGNKCNWIIFIVTTLPQIKVACFNHTEIFFSFRAEVRKSSVLQSNKTCSGTHSSPVELVSGPVPRKESGWDVNMITHFRRMQSLRIKEAIIHSFIFFTTWIVTTSSCYFIFLHVTGHVVQKSFELAFRTE